VARGRTSQCAHFNAAAQRRYSSVTVSSCAQKNRLNVNPEIPVRREESEESVYHTDGGWLGGWVAGRLGGCSWRRIAGRTALVCLFAC